jgi:DNA polymerase III delta prime subunit
MGLLDTLIATRTLAPPKLLVYGPPGAGKTTLAASAKAVLLDCENGAGTIPGLRRTPYLESWKQMREWLVELAKAAPGSIPVAAVDTIDWMVHRITEHVVIDLDGKSPQEITNTLGTAHGGYYRAREVVVNVVSRELFPILNAITSRGTAVLLLAHAANARIKTPEGFDLHLAAPDLPSWLAPMFIEWADAVLYIQQADSQRTLQCVGTNVVQAKNRYRLPAKLPLDWSALMQGITSNMNTQTPSSSNGDENHG